MFGRLSSHSTIISLVFLAVLTANIFAWHNAIVGFALCITYLAVFGLWIGQGISPSEHPALQWWTGTWILLSAVMLVGSAAYYFAAFTPEVASVIAFLTPPIAWWVARHHKPGRVLFHFHNLFDAHRHRVSAWVWLAAAVVLAGLYTVLSILSSSVTTESIRSPWLAITSLIFVPAFAALALLTVLLFRGRERALIIPLTTVALFAFLSVTLLVFPLGYGFDSFIHQATQRHIAEFGTITPKPLYYVGQYALVLFAHHAFSLPVDAVDRFLLPVLAALLLPLAWYAAAAHLLRNRQSAAASLIGLFLLPLSSFIVTTPQGLANLWTLLLILAVVPYLLRMEKPRVFLLAIPTLAALVIHPIAGIPAALFLCLVASEPQWITKCLKPLARTLFWTIAALGSVVLPLSFLINATLSGSPLGINWSALTPGTVASAVNVSLFFENRFHPLIDFIYLYGRNALVILAMLSAVGWWLHRNNAARHVRVCAITAAMLAVNFIILSTVVDFSFLIDYERLNYADRLVPLATFFLAPLVILGLGSIATRLRSSPLVLRAFTVLLLAAVATSAWYLAYPRKDAYDTSHGFNVGQADFEAVERIESEAGDEPYVVLANQSVSAAAISTLGFRYYGDQFFYPIPTGGAMYQLFLDMNERPSREIAEKTMNFALARCRAQGLCKDGSINTTFYVVNVYWWEAPRIIETAKQNATSWWSLKDGAIHIFRYDRE